MRVVVLSDIHGNLAALNAVLADAQAQGGDAYWFLGDVVGYGPRPLACIKTLDRLPVEKGAWLLGNHDLAALRLHWLGGRYRCEDDKVRQLAREDNEFRQLAGQRLSTYQIIDWHAQQLAIGLSPRRIHQWRRAPTWTCIRSGVYLAHGAILSANQKDERNVGPNAYISRGKHAAADNTLKELTRLCKSQEHNPESVPARLLLVGHLHMPVLLREKRNNRWQRWERCPTPFNMDEGIELGNPEDGLVIINVGSVGQPRDGDPRASYVVLEMTDDPSPWRLWFRRVEYDIKETQAEMTPHYPEELRDRLAKGI